MRPHALIRKIDPTPALSVDGVVAVAGGSDVPGENRVGVFLDDQPLFATDKVRYEADCIAIVAAETPEAAAEGASRVKVDLEDLAAAGTPEEASAEGAHLIHEKGNLAVDQLLEKGEVATGEAESTHIVDETLYSPVQELLARYEAALQRSLDRGLQRLHRLQDRRQKTSTSRPDVIDVDPSGGSE